MNEFNSFIMGHSTPKFVRLLWSTGFWAVRFLWVASCLETILIVFSFLVADMKIVASRSICTKSFDTKIVTNFGFILEGEMHFFPDFLFTMSKGALICWKRLHVIWRDNILFRQDIYISSYWDDYLCFIFDSKVISFTVESVCLKHASWGNSNRL